MSHPIADDAFVDARALMDRALDSPKGIRVTCTDPRAAWRLRMKCYSCRDRDRKQSLRVYSMSHQNYGKTAYDSLTFWRETEGGDRIPGNPGDLNRGPVLVISPFQSIALKVEEIK